MFYVGSRTLCMQSLVSLMSQRAKCRTESKMSRFICAFILLNCSCVWPQMSDAQFNKAPSMQVGFLLPASRYMWNESRLVNREEQYLQTSRGYNYNRQQLDVSVDMAAVNESGSSLPQFTLVWDSWETGPMFAFNVTYDDGE